MTCPRMIPLVACIAALSQVLSAQESRYDKSFRDWDKNKDGKLSKEELPDNTKRNFERMDTDKGGFISFKEHVAYLAKGSGKRQQQRPKLEGYNVMQGIFYASTDNVR